jgi:tRNA (guanine-N7-)-methyltransferase
MRIRKKPWAEEELGSNKAIITSPADNKGKWSEFFGNDNPIHVEIGCGRDSFCPK